MSWRVITGDCVESMRAMPEASVDAVVTDPPYGLEFMGKDWDSFKTYAGGNPNMKPQGSTVGNSSGVTYGYRQKNPRCRNCGKLKRNRESGACKCPSPNWDTRTSESAFQFQCWVEDWAVEALRVLKPGGHLLAFGGTRTYHRLAAGIEDAGFEIRDCLAWLYGSGFPKSLDVSKAIDKAAGAERVPKEWERDNGHHMHEGGAGGNARCPECGKLRVDHDRGVCPRDNGPQTPEAERWSGWGTALKPAHEPIVVARKPLAGTVAGNVLAHGTGALNIDGCRIGTDEPVQASASKGEPFGDGCYEIGDGRRYSETSGRWPANVLLDDQAAAMLDEQTADLKRQGNLTHGTPDRSGATSQVPNASSLPVNGYGDQGGASRFYYVAKSSSAERNAGLVNYAQDDKICACLTPVDPAASPLRDTSEPTEAAASDSCITGSGSSTADPSPTASKFTTATRSKPTTGSTTSNSSAPSITSESTPRTTAGTRPASGSDAATSAANGPHRTPSTTTSAAKAGPSTADADPATSGSSSSGSSGATCADCGGVIAGARRNVHPLEPTVKPIEVMRWLVRLVTPPGGLVVDPFCGSGTTGCAAVLEGMRFVGLEREAEYVAIAEARIAWWAEHPEGVELVKRLEAERERAAVKDAGQLGMFDEEAA